MKPLLLISIAVLIFSADTVLACTCAPPQAPLIELERATALFSGKVTKIKGHDEVNGMFATVEVVFKVERVWKGIENKTISVFTFSMSSACGYGFKKGISYLVYAYGNEQGKLATSICSRTSRFGDLHEDLEELGPGTKCSRGARCL